MVLPVVLAEEGHQPKPGGSPRAPQTVARAMVRA